MKRPSTKNSKKKVIYKYIFIVNIFKDRTYLLDFVTSLYV